MLSIVSRAKCSALRCTLDNGGMKGQHTYNGVAGEGGAASRKPCAAESAESAVVSPPPSFAAYVAGEDVPSVRLTL